MIPRSSVHQEIDPWGEAEEALNSHDATLQCWLRWNITPDVRAGTDVANPPSQTTPAKGIFQSTAVG